MNIYTFSFIRQGAKMLNGQHIIMNVHLLIRVCVGAVLLTIGFASFVRAAAPSVDNTIVIVTSFSPSMFETFKVAFEAERPDITVLMRGKQTSAAISFIEERLSEPADLFWASAPDAFEVLKAAGLLQQAFARSGEDVSRIGTYPIDDPDGFYKGFAVSGYGIVWNNDYLADHGLRAPASWNELKHQNYNRHIGMSAPSRSGTTHLIVESILQSQGWRNGWATLLEMGGNLATVTARSFGVIDGVLSERFGIGLVIDFFGISAKATGSPVDFIYPAGTAFLPANIALLKRSTNPGAAMAFINFVLSKKGQRLLFEPEISRLPVLSEIYGSAPTYYTNPFGVELTNKAIVFDANISRQRYQLVNSMFDVMITFRLKSLRRTWKVIHEAEYALQGLDRPDLQARVKKARALASEIPVTHNNAKSADFSSIFVRHKPGFSAPQRQYQLEAEWTKLSRLNQDRAYKIAISALSEIQGSRSQ